MDNINQNQNANMGSETPMAPAQEDQMRPVSPKGGVGPLIGSIIVIVILVIGAIYFWGDMLNKQDAGQKPTAPLSVNDDVNSLQQDLNNTPDIQIDIDNI